MVGNVILIVVENDEPSWVVEQAQAQRGNALIERKSELEARLRQVRAKELRQKQSYENSEPKAKRTVGCRCMDLDVNC